MQGLEGLGLTVFGGELQNVVDIALLVSILIAGDNDVLAIGQTSLTGQILALLLTAGLIQVQLSDGGTGGIIDGVLCALSLGLGRSSLRRSGDRRSGLGGGCGGGSGSGRRAAAGGQDQSGCQSGRSSTKLVQFH